MKIQSNIAQHTLSLQITEIHSTFEQIHLAIRKKKNLMPDLQLLTRGLPPDRNCALSAKQQTAISYARFEEYQKKLQFRVNL